MSPNVHAPTTWGVASMGRYLEADLDDDDVHRPANGNNER
jgi:hypothetical protein